MYNFIYSYYFLNKPVILWNIILTRPVNLAIQCVWHLRYSYTTEHLLFEPFAKTSRLSLIILNKAAGDLSLGNRGYPHV